MAGDEEGTETVQAQIGEQLLAILKDSYGTSAERFQVLMSDDAVVVFMDDLELQRSEEFLISEGEGDMVMDVRSRFQTAIESTFRAVVERTTGRRVVSFASLTRLDPNYSVEIFRLEPESQA
jgi:uncharacterized protein YbcI